MESFFFPIAILGVAVLLTLIRLWFDSKPKVDVEHSPNAITEKPKWRDMGLYWEDNIEGIKIPEDEKARCARYYSTCFKPEQYNDIDIAYAEQKLDENPQHYESYWNLLSHYKHKHLYDGSEYRMFHTVKLAQLILYGSEYFPDSNLLASVFKEIKNIYYDLGEQFFGAMDSIWSASLANHKNDAKILRNCGYYLSSIGQYYFALEAFEQANRAKPSQVKIVNELKKLNEFLANHSSETEDESKQYFQSALSYSIELMNIHSTDNVSIPRELMDASELAFSSGSYEQAKHFAEDLLGHESTYYHGKARLMLAKVNYNNGDLNSSRDHLSQFFRNTYLEEDDNYDFYDAIEYCIRWGMEGVVDTFLRSVRSHAKKGEFEKLSLLRNKSYEDDSKTYPLTPLPPHDEAYKIRARLLS